MPDTRISDLTVLTAPAAGDLIPIVDISDTTMAASGTTKRVAQSVLLASVQPLDATLTALASLTIAADSLAIGTGADAFTQTTFAANTLPARASTGSLGAKPITDFGLSLIDDVASSNARTTLGLGTIATQDASSVAITGGTINGATVGATTTATGAFTSLSATGITTVAAGTAALPSIVSTTGTADTGLLFPAADTLAASTAGVERVRISSTGNVGIGTTSPNTKLEVNGTFRAGNANDTYMTYDSAADNITLRKGSYYTSFGFDDANSVTPTIGFSGGPTQLIIKAGSLYVKPTAAAGLVNAIKLENTTGTSNVSATGISLRAGGNVAKGLIAFTNQTVWGVGDFTFGINGSANNTEAGLADARMTIQGSTGNVGIGTTSPNANAILDVSSTTQAFMPPRMTTTQKNAIASPTAGMVVYDSTLNKLCVRAASAWETVTSV